MLLRATAKPNRGERKPIRKEKRAEKSMSVAFSRTGPAVQVVPGIAARANILCSSRGSSPVQGSSAEHHGSPEAPPQKFYTPD